MPIPDGDRAFDKLGAQLAREQLDFAPVLGSALGLTEFDERLPDFSASGIAARERHEDHWLERFADLRDGELSAAERIDRDLVLMTLRGRMVMRDWAPWRRSADYYAGTALSGIHVLLLHRLRPEGELAKAVAARLLAIPALLADGVANLDPEVANPKLLNRSLSQIRAGARYVRDVAAELGDDSGSSGVAAAGEVAGQAFEDFAAHVTALADQAVGDWAIGEVRYDELLRLAEGLTYTTRQMRERGRTAYDELDAEMRRRSADIRGDEDWRALLDSINDDHPASPEEMLSAYREATDQARQFCIDRELVTMPDGERCEVVPSAPFTRAMVAVAHYIQPPPFADRRVGHFFVPYPPDDAGPDQVRQRLATNNRSGLWSITTHEAYPGHHWHLAKFMSGGPGGLRPLRTMFGSTYFVEGWGLYSEDLMRAQGFFATAEQEICQLDMRLFRAARIIVDTSLHLGEMTVEEAVKFMSTKSSLTPDTARAEVLRYCATPTQASAYLTGALEIARLRDRWLAEGRGTLRDFHDRAAGSGRLPMNLVARTLFDAESDDEPPAPGPDSERGRADER